MGFSYLFLTEAAMWSSGVPPVSPFLLSSHTCHYSFHSSLSGFKFLRAAPNWLTESSGIKTLRLLNSNSSWSFKSQHGCYNLWQTFPVTAPSPGQASVLPFLPSIPPSFHPSFPPSHPSTQPAIHSPTYPSIHALPWPYHKKINIITEKDDDNENNNDTI